MTKSELQEFEKLPIFELLDVIQEIISINELVKSKIREQGDQPEDLEIMSKLLSF